ECNADHAGNGERCLRSEVAELEERGGGNHRHAFFTSGAKTYPPANAAIMNNQLPTLSNAPPVSASPLVQPRASTAPMPITAPPPNAYMSRTPRPMRGPRS